jgi:hypothetical protein
METIYVIRNKNKTNRHYCNKYIKDDRFSEIFKRGIL